MIGLGVMLSFRYWGIFTILGDLLNTAPVIMVGLVPENHGKPQHLMVDHDG